MMGRVKRVAVSGMRVMCCRLVMSSCVVTGRFLVMLRSVLVMLGGLRVMGMRRVRGFLSHAFSP
jgi:hypothetical protein